MSNRPAPVLIIEGEEHVVDTVLSHRKRWRAFQFLTLMKGGPPYGAVCKPTKYFADNGETVTDAWQKSFQDHGILPECH